MYGLYTYHFVDNYKMCNYINVGKIYTSTPLSAPRYESMNLQIIHQPQKLHPKL